MSTKITDATLKHLITEWIMDYSSGEGPPLNLNTLKITFKSLHGLDPDRVEKMYNHLKKENNVTNETNS